MEVLREELSAEEFTGDPDVAVKLDEHDRLGVRAGKTWSALLALEDYGRATSEDRCPRDVAGYLKNLPDGCRGYSANRHARDESDEVRNNARLCQARWFPVPVEVDSGERTYMGAHFKIALAGMISPRLHYLDDTARSGTVYVGPHLPTKQTN